MTSPIYDINAELEKRGIRQTTQVDSRKLNYIGAGAQFSFQQLADQLKTTFAPTNTDVSAIGDAYSSGYYQKEFGSNHRTYEAAYGTLDWSVAAQDPSTLQVLDEVYGNTASNADTENVDPNDLRNVYDISKSANNLATAQERSGLLANAQNMVRAPNDADTSGIRAVSDFDAPIEPYA